MNSSIIVWKRCAMHMYMCWYFLYYYRSMWLMITLITLNIALLTNWRIVVICSRPGKGGHSQNLWHTKHHSGTPANHIYCRWVCFSSACWIVNVYGQLWRSMEVHPYKLWYNKNFLWIMLTALINRWTCSKYNKEKNCYYSL